MPAATKYSKAVVATGGKQYLVSVGSEIMIEKLPAEVGATVTLGPVVFAAEGSTVATPTNLKGLHVSAEVMEHGRGDKIRVFKFKSKKRYRRTQGHRQGYTKVKVTAIGQTA